MRCCVRGGRKKEKRSKTPGEATIWAVGTGRRNGIIGKSRIAAATRRKKSLAALQPGRSGGQASILKGKH